MRISRRGAILSNPVIGIEEIRPITDRFFSVGDLWASKNPLTEKASALLGSYNCKVREKFYNILLGEISFCFSRGKIPRNPACLPTL